MVPDHLPAPDAFLLDSTCIPPMNYLERIQALKAVLETMESPAKLDLPFSESRPPTQAFSEFLTNKEQGDWAEATFIANFNQTQPSLWAVKYGRSEDLIAGEPGFDAYYRSYQAELRMIGKRPDLLIFEKSMFIARWGMVTDISTLDQEELDAWTPRAKYAIEVRSSAFISKTYESFAEKNRLRYRDEVISCAKELLENYRNELSFLPGWRDFCETLLHKGLDGVGNAPRAGSKRSTELLTQASNLTKEIKKALKALEARDFLSITPKAEDLSLVYRWIEKFGVPHYYCQVFFDRAVLLSFEEILGVLAKPDREGIDYFIEADEKNQRKVVFKINVALGREVMSSVMIPEHQSAMKELPKGRLLFYVRFSPSAAKMEELGL